MKMKLIASALILMFATESIAGVRSGGFRSSGGFKSSGSSSRSYSSGIKSSQRSVETSVSRKSYIGDSAYGKSGAERLRAKRSEDLLKPVGGTSPSADLSRRLRAVESSQSSKPGYLGTIVTAAIIYQLLKSPDNSAADRAYLEKRLAEAKQEEAERKSKYAENPLPPKKKVEFTVTGIDQLRVGESANILVATVPQSPVNCQGIPGAVNDRQSVIHWTPAEKGTYILRCDAAGNDFHRALVVN